MLQTPHGSNQLVVVEDRPFVLIRVDEAGDVDKWQFAVFLDKFPLQYIDELPEKCVSK